MTAFGSKFFGLEMNGPSKYCGSGLSAPLGSPVWLLSFNVVKTMQVSGYVPLNNYRYVGKIDLYLYIVANMHVLVFKNFALFLKSV